MNKALAQRQLKIGYYFAVIGFIIGISIYKVIKQNFFLSGLIIAYSFWGIYWGFRIVNQPVQKFFSGAHITEKSISQLIWKHILYKLTLLSITFILAYIIGLFGGAIYKQITLINIK